MSTQKERQKWNYVISTMYTSAHCEQTQYLCTGCEVLGIFLIFLFIRLRLPTFRCMALFKNLTIFHMILSQFVCHMVMPVFFIFDSMILFFPVFFFPVNKRKNSSMMTTKRSAYERFFSLPVNHVNSLGICLNCEYRPQVHSIHCTCYTK